MARANIKEGAITAARILAHIAIGAVLFAAVFVVAWLVSILAHALEDDFHPYVVIGMRLFEYTLLGLDGIICLVYIVRQSWTEIFG